MMNGEEEMVRKSCKGCNSIREIKDKSLPDMIQNAFSIKTKGSNIKCFEIIHTDVEFIPRCPCRSCLVKVTCKNKPECDLFRSNYSRMLKDRLNRHARKRETRKYLKQIKKTYNTPKELLRWE